MLKPLDKVLPLVLLFRRYSKIKGTYVDGYQPAEDGKVHTHFGQATASLRFNSWDPNIQNVMKLDSLSKDFRKMFIAPPGYLLWESDHKSAESVLTGYYAQDQE